MSLLEALLGYGTTRLVVGVEPDELEPHLLRVYIDARYRWTYVLVADTEDQRRVLGAWRNEHHVYIPVPEGSPIYQDDRVPHRYAWPMQQSWNAT